MTVDAFHLHLSKAVVGHLVHKAVEQRRRASLVYPELSLGCEVVALLREKEEESDDSAMHTEKVCS